MQVVDSASGLLHVTVRTSPQPPVKGVNAVQYQITDAAGGPVDGLDVTAFPWMPAHGHGTSVQPTITAEGAGIYQIVNVYLYMSGRWELRSDLGQDGGQDSVIPVFDVP